MLEQRRYERVDFFCPLEVTVLPNGPSMPGRAFDISIGGVGIITELSLTRGQPVSICFHLHNGSANGVEEYIIGQVAYSRADEDGDHIGIEFLKTIDASTYPALTAKLNSL